MARHFLLAILLCLIGTTQAADPFKSNSLATQDEFLPVNEAYRPSLEFAGDSLRLHWDIADGYYLYRHQLAFKTAAGDAVVAQLPAGKGKEDEFFGHVEVYYHALDIALTPPVDTKTLELEVTAQGCADAGLCYPPTRWFWRIDTRAKSIESAEAPATTITPPAKSTPTAHEGSSSWLLMLLFAVVGGSILNLMPCVFPVLSLKVLAFASHKEEHLAVHGVVYTAGVVLSFVAVAIALLVLKAAGQAIGWGFQLQQPWFVASLAYLFFAMGLSLSSFWQFGGSWMG
ncbi:MAG TPA: protein-disulfide reductase DsbD domain-containing protein, partial [Spongiibacteraceae bacterium]|nr:protein-disulfide reductase DsbD domain-containing protein [Spongiibacteraceae bacterium]